MDRTATPAPDRARGPSGTSFVISGYFFGGGEIGRLAHVMVGLGRLSVWFAYRLVRGRFPGHLGKLLDP